MLFLPIEEIEELFSRLLSTQLHISTINIYRGAYFYIYYQQISSMSGDGTELLYLSIQFRDLFQ